MNGYVRRRCGFTLVELAVVIIIIGVLAAFAVPRFLASVERTKAAEAFHYCAAIRSAQERYQAAQGIYADDVAKLDIQMPNPKYFTVSNPAMGSTGDLQTSWIVTLMRTGSAGGFGNYKVAFTDQGFDAVTSDIPVKINPMQQ